MLKTQLSNYPEIPPIGNNKAEKLVVLLHGLGSDGHDLISLVPYIQKELPTCHFISPHGVEAYDMAPFGRQWFSLNDRSPKTIINLAAKNASLIQELIVKKQKELAIGNSNTILLGFSQGSMMSIYLTLIAAEPYAATIAFSGRLIPPLDIINRSTPICVIHGKEDDVVGCEEAEVLSQYFSKNNIAYDKLIIPNLAHSIDLQGLKFALNFLHKHIIF